MAEDINTILHMSMTAQCLAQIVLKPDLHRSTPSPNFAIAGPLWPPLISKWVPKCNAHARTNYATRENMIEERCRLLPNYFSPCSLSGCGSGSFRIGDRYWICQPATNTDTGRGTAWLQTSICVTHYCSASVWVFD